MLSDVLSHPLKSCSFDLGKIYVVPSSSKYFCLLKSFTISSLVVTIQYLLSFLVIGVLIIFGLTIKDDILERTEIAYELLKVLYSKYRKNLLDRYKITSEEIKEIETKDNYIYELMKLIGKKRGAIVSGGETDDEKVSRIILDDFRNCKIGKISLEEP